MAAIRSSLSASPIRRQFACARDLLFLLILIPVVLQAQFTFTTNSDGSLNIYQYTGSGDTVVIPNITNNLPVTTIGDQAFWSYFFLTNITISTNITSIGNQAFYDCFSLTNLTIPDSVASIGYEAFWSCYSLPSITIPNSVTNIGQGAFEGSGLPNITIGNNVTNLGDFLFQGCTKLINITIGTNVSSIGLETFYDCSSLTSVTIPDSVTSIGNEVFVGCNALTNVMIGNGLTNLGFALFADCTNITSVTLGTNLINIGDGAFYGCSSLVNLIIPASVTSLGSEDSNEFQSCSELKGIYFEGNAPTAYGDDFLYDSFLTIYYLPDTTGWTNFAQFVGLMPVPWLPQMQGSGMSFGMQTNQFGFNINWASGQTVVVETCTNLSNPVWIPVATNTLTGNSSSFSDSQTTNFPNRYYQLVSQ